MSMYSLVTNFIDTPVSLAPSNIKNITSLAWTNIYINLPEGEMINRKMGILPLTPFNLLSTTKNPKYIKTNTSLLKSFLLNPYTKYETTKGEIYYGGSNICFNKDKKLLFFITRKIMSQKCLYVDPIVLEKKDVISKLLLSKIIPIFAQTGKVTIEDLSSYIIYTQTPKDITQDIQNHLEDYLLNYFDVQDKIDEEPSPF